MALKRMDPFRRLDPFHQMVSLREAMDRLFEESFLHPGSLKSVAPAEASDIPLDIYEEGNNLVVRASLPGVKSEEVNIEVRGNLLSISGETKQEEERKEKAYHRRERTYCRFERSVILPTSVEPELAEAVLEDGVLTLTLPRAADAQAVSIAITGKQ